MRSLWRWLVVPVALAVLLPGVVAVWAADDAKISDINIMSGSTPFAIVIRADAPIAAQLDQGQLVVRLPRTLLPASFPNYQSIADALVSSLSAQQTSIAPASALLAIGVRGPAVLGTESSDGGKTLRITVGAASAAGAPSPGPGGYPAPPGVPAAGLPAATPAVAGATVPAGALIAVPPPATARPLPAAPLPVLAPSDIGAAISRPHGGGHGSVSLRADRALIRDILLDIGEQTGTSLVVGDDVAGRATVELTNASLERALHVLLDARGIAWRRTGSSVIVGRPGPARGGEQRAVSERESTAVPLVHIDAARAAAALRPLFPRAVFETSGNAATLIVAAPPRDLAAIRAVVAGIDVPAATRRSGEAVALRFVRTRDVIPILRRVYPNAAYVVAPNGQLVIVGTSADIAQVRALLSGLDVEQTAPQNTTTSEVIRLVHASPLAIASALGPSFRRTRFTPSGNLLIVTGPADDIARIKAIAGGADVAPASQIVGQIYKIRYSGAAEVAGALRKAFGGVAIVEDAATNSIVVKGTDSAQAQIAAAIATLDVAPIAGGGGGLTTAVVQLQNAVPGAGNGGSTSASDMATALTSILGPQAPDLRVTVPANTTLLAISGSASTVRAAQDLLAKIDIPAVQLILDTAVYEVDETAARNVGLQLPQAVISTTFTEQTPNASSFGTPSPLTGLQKFGRTPLTFQAQLNFLITNGNGRVLANPRVTTISGRVATIRAGDNIPYVQTVQGGLVGTVSQTVLTFQTGVTLDITPIANPDGRVSVTLHPIVNTLTGLTQQGVPQISSREAQTTVNLRDNETVVIGGLIQENNINIQSKLPIVGDLPLVGGLFRNNNTNRSRNELIIVVTPHVVTPDRSPSEFLPPPNLPTPRAGGIFPAKPFPPVHASPAAGR